MFKSAIKTIVGVGAGLLTLYAVGRVAYAAGKEAAENEQGPPDILMADGNPVAEFSRSEEPQKYSKMGFLSGLIRARKNKALGELVNHPEKHRFEAELDESGVIRIAIRKKGGK